MAVNKKCPNTLAPFLCPLTPHRAPIRSLCVALSTLFEQNHNLLSERRLLSVQGVWVRHKNERFPSTFGDRVDVKGGERYENKFRTSVLLSNLY